MPRRDRSRLLTAMLVVLVAIFFAVLMLDTWIDTRVRPAPPTADVEAAPPAAAEPAAPPAVARPASDLRKCVPEAGGVAVYTSGACPPGTRLERQIAVAPMHAESPELRRARLQCEAGKQRGRIELAKLGNRRMASDLRLWGDYVARECAAYTATAKAAR